MFEFDMVALHLGIPNLMEFLLQRLVELLPKLGLGTKVVLCIPRKSNWKSSPWWADICLCIYIYTYIRTYVIMFKILQISKFCFYEYNVDFNTQNFYQS